MPVTLTIDGHEVTVPKGTTILEAAKRIGQKVPHYCYHPGMSSPAMCRLCLVEVEGAPKPMPSCVTTVMDGQVVHTQSDQAKSNRQAVLEFYLVNHPLDCPICDMSGECNLQDYVHEEGRESGRSREPKRIFGRDDFGGDVLFYGDRCVMCTRCVRFMSEVEQDSRLTVVERGSRSVIDTFFDEGLDGTHWHGNIVDICPVGALVSKDFLYKARAWDLEHTPSVCTSCSQGCNIELHTRDNLVQRLKPPRLPQGFADQRLRALHRPAHPGQPGAAPQAARKPGRQRLVDVRPRPRQLRVDQPGRSHRSTPDQGRQRRLQGGRLEGGAHGVAREGWRCREGDCQGRRLPARLERRSRRLEGTRGRARRR
ncbi:MAG TPA: 2Fe-2S iron-sulfur cluster binding domain-containing protein [Gemmatimonadetes bacterium]|nr:2Fe-2S iron-sulfur cluster binding domain-containing protein [Gemmatimonadota bacterium]